MNLKRVLLMSVVTICCVFAFACAAWALTTPDGLLTYTVADGEATVTNVKKDYEGALTIPEEIDGYPVTGFDGSAISNTDGWITCLTLPKSLRRYVTGSVVVAERFEAPRDSAYFRTDGDGVLYSADGTELLQYPMVSPVTDYVIPDGVETIRRAAFQNTNYLETVSVPGSVKDIPAMCFTFGVKLRSVALGEGVETIGNNAIAECRAMETVTLPGTLVSIDGTGISGCRQLRELVVPASVTTLANGALSDNPALERVVFLGTPENCWSNALQNNPALREIYLAATEADWRQSAQRAAMLPSGAAIRERYVDTPRIVPRRQGGALFLTGAGAIPASDGGFYRWTDEAAGCESLLIGADVGRLGTGAFADFADLAEVVFLGDAAADDGAFAGCGALETVVCFGALNVGEGAFADALQSPRVFVPADQTASGANVCRFALADGVLTLRGALSLDAYDFLDVLSILADQLGEIRAIHAESLRFEDIRIEYRDENGDRRYLEDNTLTDADLTAWVSDDEGRETQISFNDLCAGVADGSITRFAFRTTDAQNGEAEPVQISIVERIQIVIKRIAKAITTLLNALFRILKIFRK